MRLFNVTARKSVRDGFVRVNGTEQPHGTPTRVYVAADWKDAVEYLSTHAARGWVALYGDGRRVVVRLGC